jgi:hypothetical protein
MNPSLPLFTISPLEVYTKFGYKQWIETPSDPAGQPTPSRPPGRWRFYESDLSKVKEEETRTAENGDGKKRQKEVAF